MLKNSFSNNKIIYFTISQFIIHKVHLGFFSKFLDPSLNFFLLKKAKFYFFNLNYTLIYLKLVLNILKQLSSRKCSILLSIPFNFSFLFQSLSNIRSLNYISNFWLPGLLTNFKMVYPFLFYSLKHEFNLIFSKIFSFKEKLDFLESKHRNFLIKVLYQHFFFQKKGILMNSSFLMPSFICFFDVVNNFFGMYEAKRLNIPFAGFADINLFSKSSKYLIPGNSKTTLSLNLYYFLITKSLLIGSLLEKLNFLFLIEKYSSFFFLDHSKFSWYKFKFYNILKNNFLVQLIMYFKKSICFLDLFLNNFFIKLKYTLCYKLKIFYSNKKKFKFSIKKKKFNLFYFYFFWRPFFFEQKIDYFKARSGLLKNQIDFFLIILFLDIINFQKE